MPDPSGLKISQLPSGIAASGSDLMVLVQNGNTVQVPVSGVRRNTTADLPESGNLYYTDTRARNAFAAGTGLVYTKSIGTYTLDPSYISKINTAYNSNITGVNVTSTSNGRNKTIRLSKNDGSYIYGSWIDQGQDISITAGQGLEVNITNGIWNIRNSDRGSNQNIFKTLSVSGSQSIVANSNTDYITLIPGSNIGLTSNSGNRTITINATGLSNPVTGIVAGSGISANRVNGEVTINNSDLGSSQNIFKTIAVSGLTSLSATGNSDTLTVVAGSNINFSTDPANNKLVINAVSGAGLVGNVTSVNGLSGTVILTTDNIGEGSAQYFTQSRARASFSAGNGISIVNGVITNTSPLSSGAIFKFIGANSTYITAPNSTSTLTFVEGTGIVLEVDQIAKTITINSEGTGGGSPSAPTGSIQFNRLGSFSGVSSFSYNYNNATLYKTDGNIVIGESGAGHVSNTGIRIIAGTDQSGSMQTWENNSGVVQSQITSSGAFRGAVTPTFITVDSDLEVDNSYNGKVLEFRRTGSSDAVLTLGTGITIPNWNMKVLSVNSTQRVRIEATGASMIYPSDRYPRTRKGHSVVDILRRDNGDFILYGDLDTSIDSIGGNVPVDGGGGGTTGGTIGTDGQCLNANNPSTISNLSFVNGIQVSEVYNNTSVIPDPSTYPTVVNTSTALLNAWGSPYYVLPLNSAQIEIKLPTDNTCYDYIGVIDQFGEAREFTGSPPYLLNLYTTGTLLASNSSGVYEEVSFNIVTNKAGSETSITTPAKVSMVSNKRLVPSIQGASVALWWTPEFGINNTALTNNSISNDGSTIYSWKPYYGGAELKPTGIISSPIIRTGNNGVKGKPYLEFDGSTGGLISPFDGFGWSYLIAIAARFRDSSHSKYHSLLSINSGSNGIYKGYGSDNPGLIGYKYPGASGVTSPISTGTWGIYMYGYSNGTYWTISEPMFSSDGLCTLIAGQTYQNRYTSRYGALNTTSVVNSTITTASVDNNINYFAFGYDPNRANSNFLGDIGEILVIAMPNAEDFYSTADYNGTCSFTDGSIGKAYDANIVNSVYNYLTFWTT